MKTRNIILLALSALLTISCHSWDAPAEGAGMVSYGNKNLQESNVVTVAKLKDQFKSEISSGSLKQVTKATQIKVIVTGNDEGSNIYKTLYVADETGGISLSIDKSGIYSEAAVGQCMLIELEGLYVSGYGQQPQIGTKLIKEGGSDAQIGRMSRDLWSDHFKFIPAIEGLSVKPITTNDMSALDIEKDFGKVVTLVGITMVDADGKAVFAPDDGSVKLSGGCANREVANQASTVYIRTSTYAKFAHMVMPNERFDITGVISRFADDWQVMPRSLSDIQPYTGTETYDHYVDFKPSQPEGDGTETNPFNVAAAIEKCKEGGETPSAKEYYIKGYVTADAEASDYGTIEFKIADSKAGGKSFIAYRVYGSDGNKLTTGWKINKGDEAIIYGKIVNYQSSKAETSGKAIIVAVNGKKTDGSEYKPSGDSGDDVAPAGNGTQDSPFNIAAAIAKCQEVGTTASTDKYYIKGIADADYTVGSYYNIEVDLVDSEGASKKFKVYRCKYGSENKNIKQGFKVNKGDVIIVYGPVVYFKSNTPETSSGAYIVSVNGQAPELDGQ